MVPVPIAESIRIEVVNANSFAVEPLLIETEVPQPKKEGVVQPGDAYAAPIPQPPYDEIDDTTEGLRCYYQGCTFEGYCWCDLLAHMDIEHNTKFKSLQGTYFHKMGMKVLTPTKLQCRCSGEVPLTNIFVFCKNRGSWIHFCKCIHRKYSVGRGFIHKRIMEFTMPPPPCLSMTCREHPIQIQKKR